MAIVIDRKSGAVCGEASPEQRERLWRAIVEAYVEKHPEIIAADAENKRKDF